MAGLLRADLAVGAGGATTWERPARAAELGSGDCCNQFPFSEALAQAGHVQLLGDEASVTVEKIRSALRSLIAQPFAREAATAMTDGWGASRLAIAMLGHQGAISLRPAIAADEALLLYWATILRCAQTVFRKSQLL